MTTFTRIKPTLGRIAVKLMHTEDVSAGGIILPMGRQEITTVGTVTAVAEPYRSGSDDDDELAPTGPMHKVGDVVLFGKFSGSEVTIGRDKHIVLRESDVLATLHPEE